MTFSEWLTDSRERVRSDGLSGVVDSGRSLVVGGLRRIEPYVGGDPIYDDEWDVLLVLDACRYDLMTEVADEYDFIGQVGERRSVGAASSRWMDRNFGPEYADEMARTVHVTGNPFSEEYLDAEDFQVLDEVWRYAWDDDLGTVRGRPLTDRAVSLWREHGPKRMIVHYMQPHFPFVNDPDLHSGMDRENFADSARRTFWEMVGDGDIDEDTAWRAYRDNLRYVLDEVEHLLSVIDADRVAVSADHGNVIGRLGVYGHPGDVFLPVLRHVPWIETSARAEREYEPELKPDKEDASDKEVESRLEDLGYL